MLEASIGLTFIRVTGYAIGGAIEIPLGPGGTMKGNGGNPNLDILARLWSATKRIYIFVGAGTFLFIGGLACWSAPVLIAELTKPNDGWIAVGLFVMGAVLRAHGGGAIAYLYGVGRITQLRWWESFFWLITLTGATTALIFEANILIVIVAYQGPLAANVAWNQILVAREQSGRPMFDRYRAYDGGMLRQLWPSFWRATLGSAFYLGVTQGAGLYYASIGDPASVAVYLFAMSLMRPMMQFAQVPFFVKLPKLAALHAEGKSLLQVAIARRAMLFSYFILAFMIVGVPIALPPLLKFLDGDGALVPISLWFLIGAAAFLERIGAMHLQLYSITGHIIWHLSNGVTGLIYVICMIAMLPAFEVFAFPVANIVALLLFYVPYSMLHSYRGFSLKFPLFEFQTSLVPLCFLIAASLLIYSS